MCSSSSSLQASHPCDHSPSNPPWNQSLKAWSCPNVSTQILRRYYANTTQIKYASEISRLAQVTWKTLSKPLTQSPRPEPAVVTDNSAISRDFPTSASLMQSPPWMNALTPQTAMPYLHISPTAGLTRPDTRPNCCYYYSTAITRFVSII